MERNVMKFGIILLIIGFCESQSSTLLSKYCEKQQIVRLTSENLCNVNNQNCVDVVQSDEFYLICLYRSLNLLGKVESYDETVYTPLTDMCSVCGVNYIEGTPQFYELMATLFKINGSSHCTDVFNSNAKMIRRLKNSLVGRQLNLNSEMPEMRNNFEPLYTNFYGYHKIVLIIILLMLLPIGLGIMYYRRWKKARSSRLSLLLLLLLLKNDIEASNLVDNEKTSDSKDKTEVNI